MVNWPGFANSFAGSGVTGETATIAEVLPGIKSSAAGASLPDLTATMAETFGPISQHAVATLGAAPAGPVTGTIVQTLGAIQSHSQAARPFPTVVPIGTTVRFEELTHTEKQAYYEALHEAHRVRSVVTVYDGNEVTDHSLDVSDGQIDMDVNNDTTRTVSLTVLDPKLKFGFHPMGDVYLDNQIGIRYGVEVRSLRIWVDIDVFRGPVSGYEREGHEVTITAQGKESLMLEPVKQYVVPSLVTRNEVQRVDLNNFTGTDHFRLRFVGTVKDDEQHGANQQDGGHRGESVAFTRGGNYTAQGLKNGIEDLLGRGKVTIDHGPNDQGFTVTFGGHFAGTDVPKLHVTDASGSTTGEVTEVTSGIRSIQNRGVSDYIRRVTAQYGESKFDLGAAHNQQVPKGFNIDPAKAAEKGVWPYLKEVADSINMYLFYDGRGFLTMRPDRVNRIVHTFRGDDDTGDVLTTPHIGIDMSGIRNMVEVYGQDKQGHDVLKARVRLARHHPLSPENLGRHGHPRVLLEQIKLDNTKLTLEKAHNIAESHLRRMSAEALTVSFDALPVPHLEERDTCRVIAAGIDQEFSLNNFSLPLGPASMSVGYNRARPVAKFRARRLPIKHHHRHHHKKKSGTG